MIKDLKKDDAKINYNIINDAPGGPTVWLHCKRCEDDPGSIPGRTYLRNELIQIASGLDVLRSVPESIPLL